MKPKTAIIMVGVVASFFLVLTIKTYQKPVVESVSTKAPEVKDTRKTYIDKTNGFEIKYLQNYTVQQISPTKATFIDSKLKVNGPIATIEYIENITKLPHYKESITTSEEYFNASQNEHLIGNLNQSTLHNDQVYSFIDYGVTSQLSILVEHSGHYVLIVFPQLEREDKITKENLEMFRSLKFYN